MRYRRQYRRGPRGWTDLLRCAQLDRQLSKLTSRISKMMGCLAFSLFVCGNVLLFYPFSTKTSATCYNAAPMLWWGTMTVVGVGWFLLFQMLFVAVIVTAGGAVVVVSNLPSQFPP